MNSLPLIPVRLRASLSNSAHASRFVNSRTTGTRPFDRGARAAVRLLVATRAGFFVAMALVRRAFLAGAFRATAFFAGTARLVIFAPLGPRPTAFALGPRDGLFFAGAFFVGLRTIFDARGFVFIAHLFYAPEALPDRLPLFGRRLVQ